MDARYVLMVRSVSSQALYVDAPQPVHMRLVSLETHRSRAVPPSAVPAVARIDHARLDYPWIVVEWSPRHRTAGVPEDIRLWAGNVVTGRAIRLARSTVAESGRVIHGYGLTGFDLHAGRVIWTEGNEYGFETTTLRRVTLYDLDRGGRQLLEQSTGHPYGMVSEPTLSGDLATWTEATYPTRTTKGTSDLVAADLRDRSVRDITRGTAESGAAMAPRLLGRYLLFINASPNGQEVGRLLMWEIGTRGRRIVAPVGSWVLVGGRIPPDPGAFPPVVRSGMASWEDRYNRLLFLDHPVIWRLPAPARGYPNYWYVSLVGGDDIVLENGTDVSAQWVWHFLGVCKA
jgi:hypothetical protein